MNYIAAARALMQITHVLRDDMQLRNVPRKDNYRVVCGIEPRPQDRSTTPTIRTIT